MTSIIQGLSRLGRLAQAIADFGLQEAARGCQATTVVLGTALRTGSLRETFDEVKWEALTGSIGLTRRVIDGTRPFRYALANRLERLAERI